MGEAREDLLAYVLQEHLVEIMSSGITLLTRDCSFKFRNSLYAYDQIVVEIRLKKLTAMSGGLNFKILNVTRNQLAGEGDMTIACALNGKLCKLPSMLFDAFDGLFNKGKVQNSAA
jgi:acyl-CoA thioesterase FadM